VDCFARGGGILCLIGANHRTWFRDMRRNAIEVRYNAQLFGAILYGGRKRTNSILSNAHVRRREAVQCEEFRAQLRIEMVMAGDI